MNIPTRKANVVGIIMLLWKGPDVRLEPEGARRLIEIR
jgi:hypothetical protein